MKKILLWTGLILFLALIGVMIYFSFVSQTFAGNPDQISGRANFTTSASGMKITGDTPVVGSITAPSGGYTLYGIFGQNIGQICKGATYGATVSNNNVFQTKISVDSLSSYCTNNLNAYVTFLPGKYKATCNIFTKPTSLGPGNLAVAPSASCNNINSKGSDYVDTGNRDYTNGRSITSSYDLIFDKEEKVWFGLDAHVNEVGGISTAQLTIEKISIEPPIVPPAGGWAKFTAFLSSILDWFKNLFGG